MQPDGFDELARAIANGSSIDDLVVLATSRLRTLARRMFNRHRELRRVEDTDDLIQNAAIRLKRAFEAVEIDSPTTAMALAVTQLKRELIDLLRRHAIERRHRSYSNDGGDVADLPQRRVTAHDPDLSGWTLFHEAVEKLPSDQREAVHFLWYLGLDQVSAAKLLGISDRTLRRNWRLARETLREQLGNLDLRG